MKEKSCKERIREHYRSRISDIRECWELYRKDSEAYTEGGNNWGEYGLSFDYVAPGTFEGQRRGYFRFQISWGGPSDEFRFSTDENFGLTSVQYWFMDWFDGASVTVNGKDRELWGEIWEDWRDCEIPQSQYRKAMDEN